MRIFLDANILFSAAKSAGAIQILLNDLKKSGHELVADTYVIGEARRNLEIKFPEALSTLGEILQGIIPPAKLSPPLHPELVPTLIDKDRPVLAAAIEHRCEVLLTGDKTHFGAFYGKTVEGVKVLSPAGLAEMLKYEG